MRLMRVGLVDASVMLMVSSSHDRRRNQRDDGHNQSQRGDKPLERGNHERMLRGFEGARIVNSRGEDYALIDW